MKIRLTESYNRRALAAARKRGARIHGVLDANSQAIVDEERRRIWDAERAREEPATDSPDSTLAV